MAHHVSHQLAWSDSLLTGNPKIDAEHKAIFGLLGNLWSDDPLSRADSFNLLLSHLTDHFESEESSPQFEALPAKESEQHRKEHQRLRLFVQHTKTHLDQDDGEFAAAMVDFIQEQLIPHIRQYDKLLAGK